METPHIPVFTFDENKKLEWKDIYQKRQPAVLRGLALGEYTNWTLDVIAERVGSKKVTIHVCPNSQMNFIQKNFQYKTLLMSDLVNRLKQSKQNDFFICETEKYYLRSLSDNARGQPALLSTDFPNLSEDFQIPDFINKDSVFSSVLRLASPQLQLWTHYDVMDNILIQLEGSKRAVLFPPSEFLNLYMIGDKSEVMDIDSTDQAKYPLFACATKYECVLQSGDVLFIPALWLHNMTSLDPGLAVNVFWRHLSADLYDSKDVYGNKDPLPATQAMQQLQKALALLDKLPHEYSHFYQKMMINKINRHLAGCGVCKCSHHLGESERDDCNKSERDSCNTSERNGCNESERDSCNKALDCTQCMANCQQSTTDCVSRSNSK